MDRPDRYRDGGFAASSYDTEQSGDARNRVDSAPYQHMQQMGPPPMRRQLRVQTAELPSPQNQPSGWLYQDYPTTQSATGSFAGIENYISSDREEPWQPGGLQSPQSSARTQSYPTNVYSRVGSVASDPVPKRSQLQDWNGNAPSSFYPSSDSGYASFHATCAPLPPGQLPDVGLQDFSFPVKQQGLPDQKSDPPALPSSAASDSHLEMRKSGRVSKDSRSGSEVCRYRGCGRVSKNHSEAQKHRNQHDRPHVCNVQGCTRQEGFATPNDLDRHRTSVHHLPPEVGRRSGFICEACPRANIGTKTKWWPRKDNFVAHIKRKHGTVNLQHLLQISERSVRPPDVTSESGYASAAPSQMASEDQHYADHQVDQSSPMSLFAAQPLQQSDYGLFSNPGSANANFDEMAAGIGLQLVDEGVERAAPTPGFQMPYEGRDGGNGLSLLSRAATELAPPADVIMRDSPISMPTFHFSLHGSQIGGHCAPSMQWDGARPHSQEQPLSPIRPDGNGVGNSGGPPTCPTCGKSKKRDCDLRKHMKRHTRPYGCTFAWCNKRFGSRNDWKRHENSQHLQSELWRCDFPHATLPGAKCGKIRYDEPAFRNHLARRHALSDASKLSETAYDMRIGRHAHSRFWCGFCNTLIRQDEDLHDAWNARFKHIGDHFDKDANIDEWVCLEANKANKYITEKDRKRQKLRARGVAVDDDSDADAGLPSAHRQSLGSHYMMPQALAEPGPSYSSTCKRLLVDADSDAENVSDNEWQPQAKRLSWTRS